MTKLKLLSAALIATAMIATPAMARNNHVTSPHLVEDANASTTPGARNSDERHCHLAPRVGAFATQPWENGPPANLRWVIDPSRVANRPGGSTAATQQIRIGIGSDSALTRLPSKTSG
jgi:hypothetical protein